MKYTHNPEKRFKQVQYISIAINQLKGLQREILDPDHCPASGITNILDNVKNVLTQINDENDKLSSSKSFSREKT